MDSAELVRGPDGEDDQEDEAGEINGAAAAETGVAADVDHRDVGQPHSKGEENLRVEEVGGTDGLLGDEGADEETGGHAGEADKEGLEGDLVYDFERWKPREGGGLLLEAALLDEVEERCYEGEEECGVGGQQQGYVEEDPAGVELGEGRGLLAGAEGGDEAEEEADGQDEDAEGDCLVAPVDQQEGHGED